MEEDMLKNESGLTVNSGNGSCNSMEECHLLVGGSMSECEDRMDVLREQDRFLPIANVSRIMKRAVPENGKIAKDAKECCQESVSEFISFLTAEAAERSLNEKRKTINGEDFLLALDSLGFEPYVDTLREYLDKYRAACKTEKQAVDGMSASIIIRPRSGAQFASKPSTCVTDVKSEEVTVGAADGSGSPVALLTPTSNSTIMYLETMPSAVGEHDITGSTQGQQFVTLSSPHGVQLVQLHSVGQQGHGSVPQIIAVPATSVRTTTSETKHNAPEHWYTVFENSVRTGDGLFSCLSYMFALRSVLLRDGMLLNGRACCVLSSACQTSNGPLTEKLTANEFAFFKAYVDSVTVKPSFSAPAQPGFDLQRQGPRTLFEETLRWSLDCADDVAPFVTTLARCVDEMSTEDLSQCIGGLYDFMERWSSTEQRQVIAPLVRIVQSRLPDCLELCADSGDRMRLLNLVKVAVRFSGSSFVPLLRTVGQKLPLLSDVALLHLMLYFMQSRRMPDELASALEAELKNRVGRFSVNDFALMAIAFFKCKRRITDPQLLQRMAASLCENLGVTALSSVSVAAILKQLRYVERGTFWPYLKRIVQSFATLPLDSFSLYAWVHLAFWCTKLCFFDQQFADMLNRKVGEGLLQLRAKDVAVLLQFFAMLNYPAAVDGQRDICSVLIDLFNSAQFIKSSDDFPETLVAALRCAAMRDMYPMNLIESAFSYQFLKRFVQRRRHYFPVLDLFFIDCSLAIDRPHVHSPRLNMEEFSAVLSQHSNIGKSTSVSALMGSKYYKLCVMIRNGLSGTLCCRSERIYLGAVLPHVMAADLMICFKGGEVYDCAMSNAMRSYCFEDLKVPSDQTRIVLLFCHNNRCRVNTSVWLGHVEARKRQLLRLGYNVIEMNGYALDGGKTTDTHLAALTEAVIAIARESSRSSVKRLF